MKNLVTLAFIVIIYVYSAMGQQIKIITIAEEQNSYTKIDPPAQYLNRGILAKQATAVFNVDYDISVPLNAIPAFEKAIDIWSHLLISSKPIKVRVSTVNQLSTDMLGETVINSWRNNYTNFVVNTQYPMALAKQIDNSINSTEYDFEVSFNLAKDFNFETDGIFVEGKYDFITIALHEIGHGLGFVGSFKAQNNQGLWGITNYPSNNSGNYYAIHDKNCISGSQRLTNVINTYQLYSLLTSNALFYDGPNAKAANSNQNVKLYAPFPAVDGSSIYHLDEGIYPPGSQNSLLTPKIRMAEVIHDPGTIFLGMLKDYGWNIDRYISFIKPSFSDILVKGQNYTIKWYDNISPGSSTSITLELYKISNGIHFFVENINSQIIWSQNGAGNQFPWFIKNEYESGFYSVRARATGQSLYYGSTNVFEISNKPEAPSFTPPMGIYSSAQQVRLYTNTEVDEIRYEIGNTEPTINSQLFSLNSVIDVTATTIIKTKSFIVLPGGTKVGSEVSEATYTINNNYNLLQCSLLSESNQYGNIEGTNFNNKYNELKAGINNSTIYRSYVKWEGFKNHIPANSVIEHVEVSFGFKPFYSTATLEMRDYYPGLGSTWQQKYNQIATNNLLGTFNANNPKFSIPALKTKINAIINGTATDIIGIGITNKDELNTSNFVTDIYQPQITVYYRGNVDVSQKDKEGAIFGQVGYYNGTGWEEKSVPFTMNKENQITLRSSQSWHPSKNQKYQKWLNASDVVNHFTFPINSGVNEYIAQFWDAEINIKIQNTFIDGLSLLPINEKIKFRDPWLIDEPDGQRGLRNQGMFSGITRETGADWYDYSSPIDFSLSSFSQYKGVFLDQGWPSWTPPYYSV